MAGGGETDDPGGPPPGGLSRRAFLRGSAAAGLGAGLLGGAPSAAAPAPAAPKPKSEAGIATVPIVGPQAAAMSFHINGQPYSAKLEPRATLLDALRDHFDLTGAKEVCDRGTCG